MPRVAAIKGDTYRATSTALELLDFEGLVRDKKRIVIKPNLTAAYTAAEGITTDVNVVKALLDRMPDKSAVCIVEGPPAATDVFENCGYTALAEEYGVRLMDANGDAVEEVAVQNPLAVKKIAISRTVLKSDFVISAAKLKIHSIAKFTGTIKNMMGACTPNCKMRIHAYMDLSLVDLLRARRPDFAIIDGVVANEIDECVPHPVHMGVVLAGADCLAVDAVGATIVGLDPERVRYFRLAEKYGLGSLQAEIVGEQPQNVARKLLTRPFNFRSHPQKFIARALFELRMYDWASAHIGPVVKAVKRVLR